MIRLMAYVLAGVFLIWAVVIGAFLAMRHNLIYPFRGDVRADRVVGVPGAMVQQVTVATGLSLPVWVSPARTGMPTIAFFMGNSGALPQNATRLAEFVLAGYGTIAMNYRGAGGTEGQPRETVLIADALAVLDALAPSDRPLVLYGASLGAALAVQVAARRHVDAVVLETPFNRLCETAEIHYPYLPACTVMWDERWDSADMISEIEAPVLFLHGTADEIVPIDQGRRLYDAATSPKEIIVYAGGRHNDLRLYGAGRDVIGWLHRSIPQKR